MIVDSHCHLNYSIEDPSIDDVLKNAKDNNVSLMLNIATKSSEFDGLFERLSNSKPTAHRATQRTPRDAQE